MELKGTASLPQTLGAGIEVQSRRPKARSKTPARCCPLSMCEGQKLDLAGWADLLPDAWPAPESGHGAIACERHVEGRGAVATVGRRRCGAAHHGVAGVDDSIAEGGPADAAQFPSDDPPPPPKHTPKYPIEPEPAVVAEEPPPAPQSPELLAPGLRAECAEVRQSVERDAVGCGRDSQRLVVAGQEDRRPLCS